MQFNFNYLHMQFMLPNESFDPWGQKFHILFNTVMKLWKVWNRHQDNMFEDTICQYIGTNKPIYVNYLRLSHLYSFTYVYMYIWKSPMLAMRIEKEMWVKCLVLSNISFFLVLNNLIFSFPKCYIFLIKYSITFC